ncbi:hypothetical protein NDU88_002869 [Pleurodeles waltl]|uniref:Sortilin N-terminal domain-containing protein n=1 Tax=Pleurodeles waltl TaxID=8319 RepID=A0AAV7KVX4_PLEWA|nr:hypothetical protein NDU88_002869 [Pleurodeles waltl]
MTEQGNTRRIHVSQDHSDTWTMAQLPAVGHEQFYPILAANDDIVFMHVDEKGESGYGTIYTSDERGILYSKSLERHLYTATRGDTDFTNVTSLRGVFITSVLSEDNSIQSVITFDRENQSECIEQPELKGHDLEFCLFGREELLITKGYRKLPGDRCTGGINPSREEKNLKAKCSSDLLQPSAIVTNAQSKVAVSQNNILVILSVVGVLLVAVVAAVLIVKKYVCGGRFLVHRYSILQQHAEATGTDSLDTSIVDVNKQTGYHDDSDEDLLE